MNCIKNLVGFRSTVTEATSPIYVFQDGQQTVNKFSKVLSEFIRVAGIHESPKYMLNILLYTFYMFVKSFLKPLLSLFAILFLFYVSGPQGM